MITTILSRFWAYTLLCSQASIFLLLRHRISLSGGFWIIMRTYCRRSCHDVLISSCFRAFILLQRRCLESMEQDAVLDTGVGRPSSISLLCIPTQKSPFSKAMPWRLWCIKDAGFRLSVCWDLRLRLSAQCWRWF